MAMHYSKYWIFLRYQKIQKAKSLMAEDLFQLGVAELHLVVDHLQVRDNREPSLPQQCCAEPPSVELAVLHIMLSIGRCALRWFIQIVPSNTPVGSRFTNDRV